MNLKEEQTRIFLQRSILAYVMNYNKKDGIYGIKDLLNAQEDLNRLIMLEDIARNPLLK